MDELLRAYIVSVPEDYVGEVSGALNLRGAWLDGIETQSGVAEIKTRANPEAMSEFKEFLAEITGGKGKLDESA
jgi:translation elongation factor EF-G